MTTAEVLDEFERNGIRARVVDGALRLGPRDRVTPEMLERARLHRAELIKLLGDDAYSRAIMTARRAEAERHELTEGLASGLTDPEQTSCVGTAESILATCARYGVALRLDSDGNLVVGRLGAKADEPTQPWSSLLVAIEANLGAIAELVAAGWHLRAAERKEQAFFC